MRWGFLCHVAAILNEQHAAAAALQLRFMALVVDKTWKLDLTC